MACFTAKLPRCAYEGNRSSMAPITISPLSDWLTYAPVPRRQNDGVEHGLDGFAHHGLQGVAGDGQAKSGQRRQHRTVAGGRDADTLRLDPPPVGVPPRHPAILLDEVRDLAVLDDVHAQRGGGARIAPGHGVMPRRAGPPLRESAENGQTRLGDKSSAGASAPTSSRVSSSAAMPFIAHGIGPARHGIQVVAAVRQHDQASLAQHDVEVQRLRQSLVQAATKNRTGARFPGNR